MTPAQSWARASYADELIARAQKRQLARSEQWLRLGHWRRSQRSTVLPAGSPAGWTSQADGPELFLAANGKHAPRAELDATLRAFIRALPPDDAHALCRFPARYLWLRKALDIDPTRMPAPRCRGYERFVRALRPRAVVVVFSAYSMIRAASAFGHTFFRIERRPSSGTQTTSQLVDIGVDYAAAIDTVNPILYVVRGIGGGFRGGFRVAPYYVKVRSYTDHENRDLWEYRLSLGESELAMFVAHLWELSRTYFDYFFFTENCSYHVLSALEVANPSWRLLDGLKSPVLPADTIKALTRVKGLVADVTWRPSLMTQFRHRTMAMSTRQRDAVDALVDDPRAALSDLSIESRIQVLDAATDLLDLRFYDDIRYRSESPPAQKRRRLLARRAAIARPSPPLVIAPPRRQRPDLGHGSSRLAVGSGAMRGGDPYLSLSYRIALHDLADPSTGYPELSQIEFLPLELRLPLADELRIELQSLSLARVVHLYAIDRSFKRPSWQLNIGFERIADQDCNECVVAALSIGAGLTLASRDRRIAAFALLDGQIMGSPAVLTGDQTLVRLGLGPVAGLRLRIHPSLIAHFTGRWIWLPAQAPLAMWSAHGILRWGITGNMALDLDVHDLQGTLGARLSMMFYY